MVTSEIGAGGRSRRHIVNQDAPGRSLQIFKLLVPGRPQVECHKDKGQQQSKREEQIDDIHLRVATKRTVKDDTGISTAATSGLT